MSKKEELFQNYFTREIYLHQESCHWLQYQSVIELALFSVTLVALPNSHPHPTSAPYRQNELQNIRSSPLLPGGYNILATCLYKTIPPMLLSKEKVRIYTPGHIHIHNSKWESEPGSHLPWIHHHKLWVTRCQLAQFDAMLCRSQTLKAPQIIHTLAPYAEILLFPASTSEEGTLDHWKYNVST